MAHVESDLYEQVKRKPRPKAYAKKALGIGEAEDAIFQILAERAYRKRERKRKRITIGPIPTKIPENTVKSKKEWRV